MYSSAGERREEKGLSCDRRLRRRDRITEQREYQQVIEKGILRTGKRFKMYSLIDASLNPKAGFIAGKGVGNACGRNRARRLLREAYRELRPDARPLGFRLVFVAGKGIAGARLEDVRSDMRTMLEERGILVRDGGGRRQECEH